MGGEEAERQRQILKVECCEEGRKKKNKRENRGIKYSSLPGSNHASRLLIEFISSPKFSERPVPGKGSERDARFSENDWLSRSEQKRWRVVIFVKEEVMW